VTVISLVLFYLLHMITKRDNKKSSLIFSLLGILLILQVGVILVSAFQRLTLYESAYGFTKLRTITHVFMIWLGVLLLAAALMDIFNAFRRVALVLFLVIFGFTLTLNVMNVDSFIAERNIEHAIAGNKLDAAYLFWDIGDDGVPVIFDCYLDEDTPQEIQDKLEAVLTCRYNLRSSDKPQSGFLPSYNYSRETAQALFAENASTLANYPLLEEREGYFVEVDDELIWCKEID
jgi:hypothetical protein